MHANWILLNAFVANINTFQQFLCSSFRKFNMNDDEAATWTLCCYLITFNLVCQLEKLHSSADAAADQQRQQQQRLNDILQRHEWATLQHARDLLVGLNIMRANECIKMVMELLMAFAWPKFEMLSGDLCDF